MNIMLAEIRSLSVEIQDSPVPSPIAATDFPDLLKHQLGDIKTAQNPIEKDQQAVDFKDFIMPVGPSGQDPIRRSAEAVPPRMREYLAQQQISITTDAEPALRQPLSIETLPQMAASGTATPLPQALGGTAVAGAALPAGGKVLPPLTRTALKVVVQPETAVSAPVRPAAELPPLASSSLRTPLAAETTPARVTLAAETTPARLSQPVEIKAAVAATLVSSEATTSTSAPLLRQAALPATDGSPKQMLSRPAQIEASPEINARTALPANAAPPLENRLPVGFRQSAAPPTEADAQINHSRGEQLVGLADGSARRAAQPAAMQARAEPVSNAAMPPMNASAAARKPASDPVSRPNGETAGIGPVAKTLPPAGEIETSLPSALKSVQPRPIADPENLPIGLHRLTSKTLPRQIAEPLPPAPPSTNSVHRADVVVPPGSTPEVASLARMSPMPGADPAVSDNSPARVAEVLTQPAQNSAPQTALHSSQSAPQPGAVSSLPSLAATPSPSLPAQLEVLSLARPADSIEWGRGMGERVSYMIDQKQNTATIRLDPPALGKLDVQVRIADEGTTITIQTQHAQTRDLIESSALRLRDFLQENGHQNVNVDVSQRQDQQQTRNQSSLADGSEFEDESSPEQLASAGEQVGNFTTDGLLDTFA